MKTVLIALEIADLVLLLASLYFHNDLLLIVAAAIMTVCIVLTLSNAKKER